MRISDWSSDVCSSDLADWCNAARAFMFSLGCIQARSCHNDQCPTGVATQNPHRWKNLDVPDKTERVYNYHLATVMALKELLAAAGLQDPAQLLPDHILRRVSPTDVASYRSEEHTSELQSLMRISYAVLCLKKT